MKTRDTFSDIKEQIQADDIKAYSSESLSYKTRRSRQEEFLTFALCELLFMADYGKSVTKRASFMI
jgi:hypothetical protein